LTERELARTAAHRLAILRHAEEVSGNISRTCRYYGITRQSFYKWRRRYVQLGEAGLRDRSSRPRRSPRATSTEIVGKIIYLRQHYHFGPLKIAMYLKRYHDVSLSQSGVWRLRRLQLSRLPTSQRYRRHQDRWKRYEKPEPGHQVQIDVKFIAPLKGSRAKHYQFTAIDDCTRLRVLRIDDRLGQKSAIQFVDYVLEKLPFHVRRIQTDNGSEFQSAFHWHVLDRGIEHVFISGRRRLVSTARSSARTGSTPRSSTGCSAGWSSTTARSSRPSSRNGRTSTISTVPTVPWAARLPTSAYARKSAAPASAANVSCTTSYEFEFRYNKRHNDFLFRDTLRALLRSETMTYKALTERRDP
jgi:transposase-like protein